MENAIEVKNVSKSFALPHERARSVKEVFISPFRSTMHKNTTTQHALKNISFEIKKGEFFGIVGRNGSGKSTLLKLLAGIYQPSKGTITTRGRLVPFIELGVGFNPELTGRENVYLNGALLGFTKKEIDRHYDEIVAFAELEKFMDQKLKNYSSGMQVRLAFSVATRANADILLIDEVLAVGDADFQRKCYDYFRSLKKIKKTVVFVSHDMNAVREYCDRAIMIEQSKLVSSGTSAEVSMDYTRMFNDSTENKKEDKTGKRWGDAAAKYSSASLSKDVLKDKDTKFSIDLEAKAKSTLANPIFGFAIKDASGQQILGTNNSIKKQSVESLGAGNSLLLSWEVPNIFSDGTYTIDLAISDHDGTVTNDWWSDALSFTVVKEERTPYIVSPSVELSLKSRGSGQS